MKTTTAPVLATAAFARSLFTRGTDFIGPDEIRQALGFEINADIPPIPFTEDELNRARKLDQFLILHSPITMKQLHARTENKLGAGKLLYDTDWYREEPFFTKETPVLGWKLVGREVVPGSTSKNYLEQTAILAEYLTGQVFRGMELPAAYQAAINEFNEQKDMMERLMKSGDWKKSAEELSKLKLNQLFRGSPMETLYGYTAYYGINHEYLLPGMYHWSASRTSDGCLVCLGLGDADGMNVFGGGPGYSGSGLGVVFSRSVAPDLVS